jgi:hypothetical protein
MEFALVMARALLYWRRGLRAMGSARFCNGARWTPAPQTPAQSGLAGIAKFKNFCPSVSGRKIANL